jgi:uncharacterized protein
MNALLSPQVRSPLAPVATRERIAAVDTLRGFALLGILPVNIVSFALPLAAHVTPMNAAVNAYRGPFAGLGAAAWIVPHVVCELKMMTIFSVLFGAGLVLTAERASRRSGEAREGPPGFARVYYRRLSVLALFGLFHGLLIWYGDILLYYALSGLLLYPLRNLNPRALILAGLVLLGVQVGSNHWEGLGVVRAHEAALSARAAAIDGHEPTAAQQDAEDEWESIEEDHDPTPAQVASEIEAVRGSAASAMRRNTELVWYNWSSLELVFWAVRALSAMLMGMGLMKLGVLSARRSAALYVALVGVGYGVGLPIVGAGLWHLWSHRFEPVYVELWGRQYNVVGSLFVVLGHIGLVMLVCKYGLLRGPRRRLAAVGQMALTNYLSQSILGVAIFSGWGLGLFARMTQIETLVMAAGICTAQLVWSPLWLRRFRFGPAEWLWRSGTYGRWERMTKGEEG